MMFNNSGNMGLPLAVLAFGEAALPAAVVLFLVENLLHFSLGAWMLDHRAAANLWRMPVMLAALAGLAVSLLGIELWPPLLTAIRMLGDISHPAAAVRARRAPDRIASFHAWGIGLAGARGAARAGHG
jgi:predicted permease